MAQRIVPKPPSPLYPDVPWWAVLVTAFVFAVVGVIVGATMLKNVSAPGLTGPVGSSIVIDTISYMPHILLLFGVLADMLTLDGVWSIPSLIGVLSIFVNYVFQYFWKGIDELIGTAKRVSEKATASEPSSAGEAESSEVNPFRTGGKRKQKAGAPGDLFDGYKGCNVQGFGSFSTPYAPQTLVVTATVFSYYCYDLIRNRGWVNSIGAILAFFTAYFGEAAVISMQNPNGCGENGMSVMSGGVRALFEGLMFGGIGYATVQTYAPSRLPSATISPFPRKTVDDLSPGPDGKMYDKDGYPYIVLPNGQAVPDVSDAKSRAAFGEMAGDATGSTDKIGSECEATKADCPKT